MSDACPYCAERYRVSVAYNVRPPLGPCPLHAGLDPESDDSGSRDAPVG